MADDLIRQKAALLFQKYGLIRDVGASSKSAVNPQKQGFTKDFLAEVKSAAQDMAIVRRNEVLLQLKTIDQSIASAKASGDQATVIRLEQEREELKRKLHLDS